MLDWLYELPLWIPMGITGFGLVLLWTGIQRLEKRVKYAGLGVVALGVVLGLLSWFLESDREIVTRQTKELVRAVNARDWAAMEKLLAPDATVAGMGDRKEILDLAREYCERYDLRNVRITGMEASEPKPTILVDMKIYAEAEKSPIGLWEFRLEWARNGKRWELKSADSTDSHLLESVLGRSRRQ